MSKLVDPRYGLLLIHVSCLLLLAHVGGMTGKWQPSAKRSWVFSATTSLHTFLQKVSCIVWNNSVSDILTPYTSGGRSFQSWTRKGANIQRDLRGYRSCFSQLEFNGHLRYWDWPRHCLSHGSGFSSTWTGWCITKYALFIFMTTIPLLTPIQSTRRLSHS